MLESTRKTSYVITCCYQSSTTDRPLLQGINKDRIGAPYATSPSGLSDAADGMLRRSPVQMFIFICISVEWIEVNCDSVACRCFGQFEYP
jgi:hypothetical protein